MSFQKYTSLIYAFSTRLDGNLSSRRGKDSHLAREHAQAFLRRHYIDPQKTVKCQLSHEANIVQVTAADGGAGIWHDLPPIPETDGLITNEKNVFLYLITADCLPILFFDSIKEVVGIAHAGWRGTVRSIAAKMITRMKVEFNSNPQDIHILIGPAICGNCYEVGLDVYAAFQHQFPYHYRQILKPAENNKFWCDLILANQLQLRDEGILPTQISTVGVCTKERTDLYYSARGEGIETGRFASVIGVKI